MKIRNITPIDNNRILELFIFKKLVHIKNKIQTG